jgi:uncharacterized protein DUF3515
VLRRAALLVTAVVLPVVIALAVVINVVGRRSDAGPPAVVEGTTTAPRGGDLPVLPVDTPPVTPAADLACPTLMQQLPIDLAGDTARLVRSDSPYAYAWGDPAVVLICGVDPPAGFVVGAASVVVSGVEWYVDTSDPDAVVWTTVDRNVPVQVRVPASSDSAGPTVLSPIIATALPYTEPTPQR